MWSSLLALAVLGMLNPARLGVTLLVSSQPRPFPNLIAFWTGSMTMAVPALVVPLLVLHYTPALRSMTQVWASPNPSSTARYFQLGFGVLALSVAMLTAVPLLTRRRGQALVPSPEWNAPNESLEPAAPSAISQRLGRSLDAMAEGGSPIRRVLKRAHAAWQIGSPWVSWVIGLSMGPAPDVILFSLAIIVASGAVIGTQVVAAVLYVVGVLAIVETILVARLVAPAKTRVALERMHNWSSAHRRHLLVGILSVTGFSMLAHGMGVI
jgi:hypothetical protein